MTGDTFLTALQSIEQKLYKYAYKLTRDVNDARDLVQETFYKSLKGRDKFRAETNLMAWATTILRNTFINEIRRKKRQNTYQDGSSNTFLIDESVDHWVENDGIWKAQYKEVMEMVGDLPKGIKEPFMMYYRGYKYQEIAEELDAPLGTIKSKIFFARKRLKAILDDN